MKTLVKTKIVLIDRGTAVMTLIWKPYLPYLFPTVFGYWEASGTCQCSGGIDAEHLKKINDNDVANVIFDNFISPRPYTFIRQSNIRKRTIMLPIKRGSFTIKIIHQIFRKIFIWLCIIMKPYSW